MELKINIATAVANSTALYTALLFLTLRTNLSIRLHVQFRLLADFDHNDSSVVFTSVCLHICGHCFDQIR